MGASRLQSPTPSRLFLEVISDYNLQRVAFPVLRGRGDAQPLPTHGTDDAPESGLTQTEESVTSTQPPEKRPTSSKETRKHGPLLEETSLPNFVTCRQYVI